MPRTLRTGFTHDYLILNLTIKLMRLRSIHSQQRVVVAHLTKEHSV